MLGDIYQIIIGILIMVFLAGVLTGLGASLLIDRYIKKNGGEDA